MNQLKTIALLLFALLLPVAVTGQGDSQPLSPRLDIVTVDPYTGSCTIRWFLSESPDVEKYIIYATDDLYELAAIDTTSSPYVTEYLHINSFARYNSVGYSIAAIDSSGFSSPIIGPLWTVYLAAAKDSCNSRINLSWTPHANDNRPSDRYEVWVSVAEGTASPYLTLPKTDTSYIFRDYLPGTRYCFFIRATDEEGSFPSSSNRQCITTGIEKAPGWLRLVAIAVEGSGLVITGSYDRESTMDDFIVLRYDEGTSGWLQYGPAKGFDGTVSFALSDADTGRVTAYALAVLNNCGIPADSSLPGRNIVLTSEKRGTQANLQWNRTGLYSAPLFSVWRDTGYGWQETANGLSDTLWSEDLSLFAGSVTSASVAYLVTASHAGSPAGTPPSRSNVTLVPLDGNIYMPNAFTPDGDGLNDLYMPALSFLPDEYEFSIYNRSGVLLFRTADHGEGWNGRHNGRLMPSGVYLWGLRLTTPTGQTVVQRGTVTILP